MKNVVYITDHGWQEATPELDEAMDEAMALRAAQALAAAQMRLWLSVAAVQIQALEYGLQRMEDIAEDWGG